MLTKDERHLLETILDVLDGLFDRASTVADVHAVLVKTAAALCGSSFSASIEAPARSLLDLVQSNETPDRKRDVALGLTDKLREFVAEQLRRDQMNNPRRRHALGRDGTASGSQAD